jgi:RNA polymerase sigma-70 factor (ECF subfamily)
MDRTREAESVSASGNTPDPEAIVTAHETALLRYAARILNNGAAAQDVVQNVFIKLFRAWPVQAEAAGQLRAWLYRVTHNEAVDHIRRESRLRLLHERQALETADAVFDAPDCPNPAEERKRLVRQCLARLHPRERQVVVLRLQEGLSYTEIATVTGRTEGNVGNILHHAVKKLAKHVKLAGAA